MFFPLLMTSTSASVRMRFSPGSSTRTNITGFPTAFASASLVVTAAAAAGAFASGFAAAGADSTPVAGLLPSAYSSGLRFSFFQSSFFRLP